MKKRILWIDIAVMAGIFCLLAAGILFDFEKYLFRLPFVTLLAFYVLGKYARDYELRLWEKRRGGQPGDLIDKRDA